MKIPRWVWWLCRIVAAIVSAPFLAIGFWIYSIDLYERPQPFEEKVPLKGAGVWSSGTQSQSADGDGCSIKYTLKFARTGEQRQKIETAEFFNFGRCSAPDTLSRAAWFGFGNGIYLRVGNELYWPGSQRSWHKYPPFDVKNHWSLSRIKTQEGQISYERVTKVRWFYRVYQLPQNVGGKWTLIEQKSSPRRRTKTPILNP